MAPPTYIVWHIDMEHSTNHWIFTICMSVNVNVCMVCFNWEQWLAWSIMLYSTWCSEWWIYSHQPHFRLLTVKNGQSGSGTLNMQYRQASGLLEKCQVNTLLYCLGEDAKELLISQPMIEVFAARTRTYSWQSQKVNLQMRIHKNPTRFCVTTYQARKKFPECIKTVPHQEKVASNPTNFKQARI